MRALECGPKTIALASDDCANAPTDVSGVGRLFRGPPCPGERVVGLEDPARPTLNLRQPVSS
jgi:hypothetical protein